MLVLRLIGDLGRRVAHSRPSPGQSYNEVISHASTALQAMERQDQFQGEETPEKEDGSQAANSAGEQATSQNPPTPIQQLTFPGKLGEQPVESGVQPFLPAQLIPIDDGSAQEERDLIDTPDVQNQEDSGNPSGSEELPSSPSARESSNGAQSLRQTDAEEMLPSGEMTTNIQQESSEAQPSPQQSSVLTPQQPPQQPLQPADGQRTTTTSGEIASVTRREHHSLLQDRLQKLDKILDSHHVSDTRRLFFDMVVAYGTFVETGHANASFLDEGARRRLVRYARDLPVDEPYSGRLSQIFVRILFTEEVLFDW
ncbi:hypothetical protein B0T20DRAFT_54557 [Sordaria brevicollis]|uniref:Uncharacterized protein n=1 Tax=Sordaria brevicollis TaxID=83679 RepID=A0AAE0P2Y5_SORBR|nr:hypothetical protein B0T20DRAFT_54557 [Sordaria brevicollis]